MATSGFQLKRTRPQRLAVYRMAKLSTRRRVLEVGSGEGVVAAEIASRTGRRVWGLDVCLPAMHPAGVSFTRGDANKLPFRDASFDAASFHFVLLWLPDPVAALKEAKRVLSPGGAVLLLAEPDITSRRDEPDTGLGAALAESVRRQGGHPDAGRRVGEWLEEAGFRPELSQTSPDWVTIGDVEETVAEVAELLKNGWLSQAEAEAMIKRERSAQGTRRVLLPLTYGVGWIS